jgi:hypothetical protein
VINITTNIKGASERLLKRLLSVSSEPNLDAMEREIAFNTVGNMRARIHEQGKDSASTQIGAYPESYIKRRVKKYRRTADPKVILSLTRQMENDMGAGAIKTSDGYGIGFKNNFNFKKSQWNEERYKKKIFALTEDEKAKVRIIAEDFINRAIARI